MLKVILLIVFALLAKPFHCLAGDYERFPVNSEILVNELDTVERFTITVRGTIVGIQPKYFHSPSLPPFIVNEAGNSLNSGSFVVLAKSNLTGIFYDSIEYTVASEELRSVGIINRYTTNVKVHFKVIVRNDSVVRFRPKYGQVAMNIDTIQGGWSGSVKIWLDNNTADTVIVGKFRLDNYDTLYNPSVTLSQFGKNIDSLVLLPYTRYDSLLVTAHAMRGPIYSIVDKSVSISAIMSAPKDTQHTIFINLRYTPAPYIKPVDSSKISATFNNPVGSTAIIDRTIKLLRPVIYTQVTPSHPFSFQITNNNDSLLNVHIECSPKSSGIYRDKRLFFYTTTDYNGDLRKDSVIISVISSASTSDPISHWQPTTFIEPNINEIAIDNNGSVCVLTEKGNHLYNSSNGFQDWEKIPTPGSHIRSIASVDGTLFCIDSNNQTLRSIDHGKTWINISDSLYITTYCSGYSGKIPGDSRNIATDMHGGIYILVTWHGRCYSDYMYYQTIFFSSDKGISWKTISGHYTSHRITSPEQPDYYLPYSFAFERDSIPMYIYSNNKFILSDSKRVEYIVDTSDNIFLSYVGGPYFTKPRLLFDNISGIINPFDSTILITTNGQGVFMTSDHGNNWFGYSDEINTRYFTAITSIPGKPIYLGTAASGLWRSTVITPPRLSAKSLPRYSDDQLRLSPNPASTVIKVFTQDSAASNIRIFDLYGNEIINANDRVLESNDNYIMLNIKGLLSGCYYLRLSLSNGSNGNCKIMILPQ